MDDIFSPREPGLILQLAPGSALLLNTDLPGPSVSSSVAVAITGLVQAESDAAKITAANKAAICFFIDLSPDLILYFGPVTPKKT